MKDSLTVYRKKRDFSKTREPEGKKRASSGKKPLFVIQKHDTSRLHYDLRLEIDGALKSWAVPKGPSTSPKDKRLAVLTEDHPMKYANFEGVIPEGEYGAGAVIVWDKGRYRNLKKDAKEQEVSMDKCFKKGRIEICLQGKKLKGGYALVRFRDKNWLLIKMRDKEANDTKNIVKNSPKSVKSQKTVEQVKKAKTRGKTKYQK